MTFAANYWNIFLAPMGLAFIECTKVLVSALDEPLVQMRKFVHSGLEFCEDRIKYGCHDSFSISKFEIMKIRYKYIKQLSKVMFGCLYMFTRFPIAK